jgi:hypothetical protein
VRYHSHFLVALVPKGSWIRFPSGGSRATRTELAGCPAHDQPVAAEATGHETNTETQSQRKSRQVGPAAARSEVAKSAVVNSLSCPDAQRGYRHAIDEFVDWYCSEPRLSFSKTVVVRYRMHLESRHLAPGTINLRLGAVRRLAYEAADCGLLSADLAAGIRRVKGVKKLGVRLGNWLTADQGITLWQAPDREHLKGKRDRALLSVLYAHGGNQRKMTLAAEEFIRRFLLHVLPKSFVRIRQYGWMANRCRREGTAECRTLLAAEPPPLPASGEVGGRRCANCGGVLEVVEIILPGWLSRRRPSPRHAPNTS